MSATSERTWIGRNVARVEDPALLSGNGVFVGDSLRTVAAQVIAEELGISPENVVFQQADSTSGVDAPMDVKGWLWG